MFTPTSRNRISSSLRLSARDNDNRGIGLANARGDRSLDGTGSTVGSNGHSDGLLV